ncbi:phenylalanine--tRNA ligase subunit beta [archaeon]|nr:phenylalanine--tRNA ligase subunit beta [archaeon]|tara:strand:- start:3036 stop:4721 length:1686 start_codon:yes stop_codon:yes gene_type:complete
MPTITASKKELFKLIGKKLPEATLKDRISMLGTDLEEIDGDDIKVEIFPNRPDLLSTQGLGRALASFIGTKPGLREYKVKPSKKKVIVDKNVTMRPYTACAIVKGLTLSDQNIIDLMQLQEKLATTHGRNRKKSAYGIYPLESINFPVHYVAKDPKKIKFKPLGFEEEICAALIPEVHPKGKSFASLTSNWKQFPFFIDAKDNIMCMLPFTNSEETGKVTVDTKDVFIECTGIDLCNVNIALNILTTTLADMGGTIESLEIEYKANKKTFTTPNLNPKEMLLDLNRINKLLGLKLNQNDAIKWLKRMGFGTKKIVDKAKKDNLTVLIPSYRNDILHQVDFAEDIAIAFGYENFKEQIPEVATIAKQDPLQIFSEKIRQILIGLGELEVKNFHLIKETELTELMSTKQKVIKLSNSLGDHNILRDAILPSLLKTLSINSHNEYPQDIFEIGRVFKKSFDKSIDTGIKETLNLAVALCSEQVDFTAIRQVVDSVSLHLNTKISVKEISHPSYIEGRVGQIMLNKKTIGIIGEIHPQVLENWQIKAPVVNLELDLEELYKEARK